MARPKKHQDARRTEIIAFRVSAADRLRLEYAVVAEGLSPSEYARRRTLSGKVALIPTRALPIPVFDELRRIGINLGQLTRAASETGSVPAALAGVSAMIEHILLGEIDGTPRRPVRRNKDADAALTAAIRFRVTPAEYREITARAAAAGLTPSEYARQQTLHGRVAVVAPGRVLDPDASDELQAAGVAINRKARIANQTGRVPHDLPQLCAALERIIVDRGIGEGLAQGRQRQTLPDPSTKAQPPPPTPGGPG